MIARAQNRDQLDLLHVDYSRQALQIRIACAYFSLLEAMQVEITFEATGDLLNLDATGCRVNGVGTLFFPPRAITTKS
jgi:hypothetical protein